MKREFNQDDFCFTPDNVFKNGTFLGIPYQNWIEAILFTVITGYLIIQIPFVPKIRNICITVIGISVFAFFLRGLKNRSVCQVVYDLVKDIKNHKKYSLGSVNDDRKIKSKELENQFGGTSFAERIYFTIRAKFKRFDQKYSNIETYRKKDSSSQE